MSDPAFYLTIASASLLITAILATTGLTTFRAWIELKRAELNLQSDRAEPAPSFTGSRIEIADLKERLRKLEAIASGVDY